MTDNDAELLVQMRRVLACVINAKPMERDGLEKAFGPVWNTDELGRDFEVIEFAMPLVVVRRRSDDALGSLFFQHGPPRLYFWWEAHEPEERKAAA